MWLDILREKESGHKTSDKLKRESGIKSGLGNERLKVEWKSWERKTVKWENKKIE